MTILKLIANFSINLDDTLIFDDLKKIISNEKLDKLELVDQHMPKLLELCKQTTSIFFLNGVDFNGETLSRLVNPKGLINYEVLFILNLLC